MTMEQAHGDAHLMEQKAPIPSRYESKANSNETQAWMKASKGEHDETRPEVFSRVERSPSVEDVQMETPRSFFPTRGNYFPVRRQYGRGPDDDDGDDDDEEEDWTVQQRGSNSTNNCNRRLSFDGTVSEQRQVLEIRTHAPLEKITEFEGRRYRSDEALEWIKTFTYEMKGACIPQNDWCKPF